MYNWNFQKFRNFHTVLILPISTTYWKSNLPSSALWIKFQPRELDCVLISISTPIPLSIYNYSLVPSSWIMAKNCSVFPLVKCWENIIAWYFWTCIITKGDSLRRNIDKIIEEKKQIQAKILKFSSFFFWYSLFWIFVSFKTRNLDSKRWYNRFCFL